MSAVRDNSQNTTFIFKNFYHLYRQGKLQEQKKNELATGVVLKSRSVCETPVISTAPSKEEISAWTHTEVADGKKEVANHLRSLREARKRLQFLMSEIDTILKQA